MKLAVVSLKFLLILAIVTSCRPPQEATDFNLTQGDLKDGDLIKGDLGDDPDKDPRYYGEESFVQNGEAQVSAVDIIWVVDNSGSMKEEQQNLKDNFNSFIKNFLLDGKARYPFKMGVMTTEAYRTNENKDFFQGDNCTSSITNCEMYDLTHQAAERDFAKFEADFKAAVGVGINGSGQEKSLYSAHTMYQRYENWFGGDDTLSIYILISDEQEQSHYVDKDQSKPLLDENGEQYTIEKWASVFQAKKDNASKTRFYPIVRFKPIPGQDGDGDVGNRYEKLASLTGGKRNDIDKPFDDILNGIGTTIINLLDSFLLNGERKIIEQSIVVTVNGVVSKDWVYADKSIKFNNPPADAAKIVIRYEYNQ